MAHPGHAPWDATGTYVGESGETLTFYQIAMSGVKGEREVIQTEDGFVVDGELFVLTGG